MLISRSFVYPAALAADQLISADTMTGAVFIQNLPDDLQLEAMQIDGVETLIESLAHQGAQAWPELSIKASEFARHLALRAIASPPKKGLAQWLEHVQPADFHLAQACHLGLPGAIVSFEDSYKKDLTILRYRQQCTL